jgi:hypothetical protein
VPGSHGAYALPQTVEELKRILRLHLAESNRAPAIVAAIEAMSDVAEDE